MKRCLLLAFMLVVVVLGSKSPSFHEMAKRAYNDACGWTQAARHHDPDGFIDHVKGQLSDDLACMNDSRRKLSGELINVADKEEELSALRDHAERLAERFRSEWRGNSFPIVICNSAYTQSETETQISILLAQVDQYSEGLQRTITARQMAEEQIERLILQIDRTTTNLALLDTQRELLKARKLTGDGEMLVAQVDQLMNDNADVIAGSPVRSVQELLVAGDVAVKRDSHTRVTEFLSQTPFPKEAKTQQQSPANSKPFDGSHRVAKPPFAQF